MKQIILLMVLCFAITSDSYAQTWNQKANMPVIARHRSTAFSIGNKGYVGLGHLNTVSNILFDDFWQYNPASNTWTQKADFAGGARYHAHGFSIGGKAYVGAGTTTGGNYLDDNWEYDPSTNVWTALVDIPTGRRGAISFVVGNLGYLGSGRSSGGTSNNFYEYDPSTDTWTSIQTFPGSSRLSAVGFAIGAKGYMGTGDLISGSATNEFWEYDTVLDAWTQKANVGDSIRQDATGFAMGGTGYIGTGRNPLLGDDMDDFWQYNVATDTWVEIEEFLGISRRYMVSFVIANKAYAAIGTNGINFNDLWEFNPNYSPALWLPEAGNIDIIIDKKPNNSFDLKVNNLVGSHDDLAVVVSNEKGKVIKKLPVNSSEVQLELNDLPANCIYKLMKGGHLIKAGKL
ncbi:MAG: N-acetylneuraminic acid mutarotase [Crocinitomicaceae bacterium]|jgi:N-acetylneuraminic acid mutarotase